MIEVLAGIIGRGDRTKKGINRSFRASSHAIIRRSHHLELCDAVYAAHMQSVYLICIHTVSWRNAESRG
jgi:hypothetical protein